MVQRNDYVLFGSDEDLWQGKSFWLQNTLFQSEQWTSTNQIYMIYKLVLIS